MVRDQLPFGARAAQMLMKIASTLTLANPKHASLLPPSWGTLYDLSRLDQEEVEDLVAVLAELARRGPLRVQEAGPAGIRDPYD